MKSDKLIQFTRFNYKAGFISVIMLFSMLGCSNSKIDENRESKSTSSYSPEPTITYKKSYVLLSITVRTPTFHRSERMSFQPDPLSPYREYIPASNSVTWDTFSYTTEVMEFSKKLSEDGRYKLKDGIFQEVKSKLDILDMNYQTSIRASGAEEYEQANYLRLKSSIIDYDLEEFESYADASRQRSAILDQPY